MKWIHHYDLFLFDFDGLLVNTEAIHFQAYIQMCANHGFHLNWDFDRYSAAAHHKATQLRDDIYSEFPELYQIQPNWQILYNEKKTIFLELLESGQVELMPGVAALLSALEKAQINRCVVTHSPSSVINSLRSHLNILNSIPHWITRENYTHPKPDPECYLYAIQTHGKPGDRIIGFEDSPRGLKALQQSSAIPILICPNSSPYLTDVVGNGQKHYPSFASIDPLKGP